MSIIPAKKRERIDRFLTRQFRLTGPDMPGASEELQVHFDMTSREAGRELKLWVKNFEGSRHGELAAIND